MPLSEIPPSVSGTKLSECILQGESGSALRINYLLSTLSRCSLHGLKGAAVVTTFVLFLILSFNSVDLKMNKVVASSRLKIAIDLL